VRTSYDSWQVWRNDCYRTTGSNFNQWRNAPCGSGYSGYIREYRNVVRATVTYEQQHHLNRHYDTYGAWNRHDNRCYYYVTTTWQQEQQVWCRSRWFKDQRRTVTHRIQVWEDTRKGRRDLGTSYSGWRDVSGCKPVWHYVPGHELTDWIRQNINKPTTVGGVDSSHPGVSSSGGGSGNSSYDVDGDGIGDYASIAAAIEAGHSGTIRAVSNSCGACRGPRGSNTGSSSNHGTTGNGGGSFWDKVKSIFGF
jgi:hypothetical protein